MTTFCLAKWYLYPSLTSWWARAIRLKSLTWQNSSATLFPNSHPSVNLVSKHPRLRQVSQNTNQLLVGWLPMFRHPLHLPGLTTQDRKMLLHEGSLVLGRPPSLGLMFWFLGLTLHAHRAPYHRWWRPTSWSQRPGSRLSRPMRCRTSESTPRKIRKLVLFVATHDFLVLMWCGRGIWPVSDDFQKEYVKVSLTWLWGTIRESMFPD